MHKQVKSTCVGLPLKLEPLKRCKQVLIENESKKRLCHKDKNVHVPIVLLEEYVLLKDLSYCAQSLRSFYTYDLQQEKSMQ